MGEVPAPRGEADVGAMRGSVGVEVVEGEALERKQSVFVPFRDEEMEDVDLELEERQPKERTKLMEMHEAFEALHRDDDGMLPPFSPPSLSVYI